MTPSEKEIISQRRRIETLEERIRQLEEVLSPSSFAAPTEYGLTQSQNRIYAHLASRDFGTKESIMMALYSDRPGEQPDPLVLHQFIWHLRRRLTKFNEEVRTVWGVGYRLVRVGREIQEVSA